jgi:beta-aspartyl-peptidase (threonine type)
MQKFSLAIHGGAGTILRSSMTPEKEAAYQNALNDALKAGYSVLHSGGAALDAVIASVFELENNPLFNAGYGAVFTNKAEHELDASLMNGQNRMAGSVASLRRAKNPILAARAVMEQTGHVMLCGPQADAFAESVGLEMVDNSYFSTEFRREQLAMAIGSDKTFLDHDIVVKKDEKFGTVGAVAKDVHGNLAAATSTGGMTNKKFGRVGDSPLIGCGTWADNSTCAVSATGYGEFFIRWQVAYDIHCLMDYKGFSLKRACETVILDKLHKAEPESGGVIAVDAFGNIELCFNSEGMYRGSVNESGEFYTGIYK